MTSALTQTVMTSALTQIRDRPHAQRMSAALPPASPDAPSRAEPAAESPSGGGGGSAAAAALDDSGTPIRIIDPQLRSERQDTCLYKWDGASRRAPRCA